MNRRSFLSVFGAAAIGATFDLEQLLWVPGKKTIFLPSVVTMQPQMFITMKAITEEALKVLNFQVVLDPARNLLWHRIEDMDDVVNVPMPSRFYPSSR